jgi:hypothetical protein
MWNADQHTFRQSSPGAYGHHASYPASRPNPTDGVDTCRLDCERPSPPETIAWKTLLRPYGGLMNPLRTALEHLITQLDEHEPSAV